MHVTKTVKITFASPKLNAANYDADIYEALEHAKLNLLSRYNVGIRNFRILDYKSVAVDMAIPEDISESFNIGNHLRGVSKYMIRHHEERYKSFCVGTRLLYYEDVTNYFPPRIVDYNGKRGLPKIIEVKNYFSVEELSSIFDVTEETVRRWIRSGKLKSFMPSKREGNVVCSDDVSAFCASFKPQYKSKWIAYCKQYDDSGQAVHWKTEHEWKGKKIELIDRKEATEWVQNILKVNKYYHPYAKSENVPIGEVIDALNRVPTIDTVQYTNDEIQRMQDIEQAQIQKAYDIGKTDAKQQWIPCSERLPKPFEYCLFTTTDGEVVYRHWDGMASRYKAWMPLPEPYKAERKEE